MVFELTVIMYLKLPEHSRSYSRANTDKYCLKVILPLTCNNWRTFIHWEHTSGGISQHRLVVFIRCFMGSKTEAAAISSTHQAVALRFQNCQQTNLMMEGSLLKRLSPKGLFEVKDMTRKTKFDTRIFMDYCLRFQGGAFPMKLSPYLKLKKHDYY